MPLWTIPLSCNDYGQDFHTDVPPSQSTGQRCWRFATRKVTVRFDCAIFFEEPGESAHLCLSVIIILHINDYTLFPFEFESRPPIQFVIRFERKFPIRRFPIPKSISALGLELILVSRQSAFRWLVINSSSLASTLRHYCIVLVNGWTCVCVCEQLVQIH